ncbi:hypothetical protein [Mesorhizobium sp. B2-5-11]|uniref:hypothetical protein n=1 Tax=Mesorhizobium sp. B2-5-11 TaxID=2589919 RepID=UPI00112EB499|nr:hypothetical protein [Mesorhizobium sp. B2-5-11]TPK14164.1 hypothetical protein FJ490_02250 [Mesorhizobium sp. B2-5-11]
MAGFYDDMAEMVTELLQPDADGGLGQGTVQLKRETPGVVDPDQPWVPVEPTVTTWPLDAAVRRVSQKYVDGTLIVATDNQVTFAVPAVMPVMTDLLVLDGAELAMKDLRPIPPAGTVVAYIAFVAG